MTERPEVDRVGRADPLRKRSVVKYYSRTSGPNGLLAELAALAARAALGHWVISAATIPEHNASPRHALDHRTIPQDDARSGTPTSALRAPSAQGIWARRRPPTAPQVKPQVSRRRCRRSRCSRPLPLGHERLPAGGGRGGGSAGARGAAGGGGWGEGAGGRHRLCAPPPPPPGRRGGCGGWHGVGPSPRGGHSRDGLNPTPESVPEVLLSVRLRLRPTTSSAQSARLRPIMIPANFRQSFGTQATHRRWDRGSGSDPVVTDSVHSPCDSLSQSVHPRPPARSGLAHPIILPCPALP
eukprot:gene18307-biopygen8396